MTRFCTILLIAAAGAANAQDAPLKVFCPPAPGHYGYLADRALRTALARLGFQAVTKADPATVVATPDAVEHTGREKVSGFEFTLHFSRNGDAIGEAEESCDTGKMDACIDQIAADLTAAAAVHP